MVQTVSERVSVVRADNPGIMTLDGTNTWVLREPGATTSVVVDPGPDDAAHLEAVHAAAGRVGLVLYTHHHADHTEALDAFAALTGAPSRAVSPEFCRPGTDGVAVEPLTDGEIIDLDGLRLEVVLVPGHTKDSVAFRLLDEPALLSGDTVLGHGTTVIAHPDGVLGAYLDSVARLRALADEGLVQRILPGHGPVVEQALAVLDFYLEHRQDRLEQVRAALEAGDETACQVVERVYADVDPVLWPAAERSVEAQLEYLRS